jgi:hypothetical protein
LANHGWYSPNGRHLRRWQCHLHSYRLIVFGNN